MADYDAEQAGLFAIVAWFLWKMRNKAIHEEIINASQAMMQELFKSGVLSVHLTEVWTLPCDGNIKIDADGAWNSGKASAGVIHRESDGLIIACLALPLNQCTSSKHYKLLALKHG